MFPASKNTVVKNNAGHIDRWPTCLTPLATTTKITHKKNKPALLQNLETLLKNELIKLNGYETSKVRLQVYKEVFDCLIKEFSTYKPLLSEIKQEYDAYINFQESNLREYDALKRTVSIINEECEQKIMKLKHEEKKDIIDLQDENENLKKKILSSKQEIDSLNFQVKKCQEDIAVQYEKYREESDSRKLLIQDLNDLMERRDSKSSFDGVGTDDEQVNDPIVLRIALSQVREDFNKNTQKLAEVLASYGDVVPRRDFEKLEAQFKDLEVSFEMLKKDHTLLLSENKILISVHEKDTDLHFRYDTLHESATPRPSFNKYVLYLEGTVDNWLKQTEGKSTIDKVDMLFSSVTGQDLSDFEKNNFKVFQSKGSSEEIPVYLHSTQPVRNRFLCKRDLCIMINDVWSQKCLEEGYLPLLKRSCMSQYLYDYLKKRFHLDLMVTEWGYNIHESCLRFLHDEKVKFFFEVLTSEVDEDVFYVRLMQQEKLLNSFVSFDSTKSDYIENNDFRNCLQNFFPNFATEDIDAIINSAVKDLGVSADGRFVYKSLFKKDEEGNYGFFITCIITFSQKNSKLHVDELMTYLESKTQISPMDLQEAMHSIESNISNDTAQHVLNFVFRANNSNQTIEKLPKNDLLTKLMNSSI